MSITETALSNVPEQAGITSFGDGKAYEQALRVAQDLSKSDLVPQDYRGKPANCLIAIELAARTGSSIFAVMQNLQVIRGNPGWKSTFLIATVNTSSRFTPLRFRFEGDQGTREWGCRAVAKDKATGEELEGTLVTWGMVEDEGWNKDGKDKKGNLVRSKWNTMPELMFQYRSAAFWTRVHSPEISLGMHTADELTDRRDDSVRGAASPNAMFADALKEDEPIVVQAEVVKPQPSTQEVAGQEEAGDEAAYKKMRREAWDLAKELYGDEAAAKAKIRDLCKKKKYTFEKLTMEQLSDVLDSLYAIQDERN